MEIVRGYGLLGQRLLSPAVAIGNFDGVHLGHASILRRTVESASQRGSQAVVLTFDPHPARVLAPRLSPPLITTPARKLELFAEQHVDLAVVQPFDSLFAGMPPEEFVERVLLGALGVSHVLVGFNFSFGRGRAGSVELLREQGARHGFGVTVFEPVAVDGLVVSSTKIREFVLEGRVDCAAMLLGRPYELCGRVGHGAGRGHKLGIATANLEVENELLPLIGVYSGWTVAGDGKRRPSVINIGQNPTFVTDGTIHVESHVLDFGGDLYGQPARLELCGYLRGEKHFPSADALLRQIEKDIARARQQLDALGGEPR